MFTPEQKTFFKDFKDALFQPSQISVITAFIVIVTTFVISLLLVNEKTFGKKAAYRYWMQGPFDHYTYMSSNVVGLRYRPLTNKKLIITGSSSTHESFTTPDELEKKFITKAGYPIDVWDLTSSAQWNWETLAIVDRIPTGVRGVVVLPVALSRFSTQAVQEQKDMVRHPKIGFTSASLDNEFRIAGLKSPLRTGFFLVDNIQFFAVRAPYFFSNLKSPIEHQRCFFSTIPKMNQAQWDTVLMEHVKNKINFYEDNVNAGLGTYARTIKLAKSKGNVKIVLLQDPMNPRFIHQVLGVELYKKYKKLVQEFADTAGVKYLDINDVAELKDEDFYDHAHLRLIKTKLRYSELLVDSLLPYFKTE